MTTDRIVVVGAGHGGATVAALLRQFGHAGPVTLLSDEALAPYHRPPLSKAWLTDGRSSIESLLLRPSGFYETHDIHLRLNAKVESIDREAKCVALAGGASIDYDVLVLACGSHASRPPIAGLHLEGVSALRGVTDAEKIRLMLAADRRVAVIGGGYIGLEVAASACTAGARVTLFEREDRLLARVVSEPISAFFAARHAQRGVEVRTGAGIAAIEGARGRVEALRLCDGTSVPCDAVVIGTGALPSDALARAAGLACDDGVLVDAQARSSDPSIFAIGDMSRRAASAGGYGIRLESVGNALEQARLVASAIARRAPPAAEVPWFWSDQFDVKLQIAGLPIGATDAVLRGDPSSGSFAVFHLRDDVLVCVEAVNAATEFVAGRLLIAKGRQVAARQLRDPNISMKALLA